MVKNTNNMYEVYFNEADSVKLVAENNIKRDIIAMTIRLYCGQQLVTNVN